MNTTLKTIIASTLSCLLVWTTASTCDAEDLQAESVWLPEVEAMYQSDVETPGWITEPAGLVVVRGIADGGRESARAVAIRKLIVPELKNSRTRGRWSHWEQAIAEREVGRWLEYSGCIVQRFEQPFYKVVDGEKYAAFTREAWLLDLSDANFDSLKRRIEHSIQSTKRRQRFTIGSATVVVGALFLGCWFACAVLDRLTRGYYVGWLRLAATTVFILSTALAFQVTRIILRSL